MDHFAGLDVSVKETSVCIVDDTGRIVREVKVASEPEALLAVLATPTYHFTRIGFEAGPLSQWLYSALAEAGLPVICAETRRLLTIVRDGDVCRRLMTVFGVGPVSKKHLSPELSPSRYRIRTKRPIGTDSEQSEPIVNRVAIDTRAAPGRV
jgi:transposase